MLAKLGVGFMALTLGLGVPAGVAVQQYGVVTVEVSQEGGEYIFVPVPLALVSFALNFVPAEQLREEAQEMAEYGPIAVAILGSLAECDDAVFVEVETPDENVLISKEGSKLIVKVDSPDEHVFVALPLSGAKRIVQKLTDMSVI
jgi:virulence-associated protein VagC